MHRLLEKMVIFGVAVGVVGGSPTLASPAAPLQSDATAPAMLMQLDEALTTDSWDWSNSLAAPLSRISTEESWFPGCVALAVMWRQDNLAECKGGDEWEPGCRGTVRAEFYTQIIDCF